MQRHSFVMSHLFAAALLALVYSATASVRAETDAEAPHYARQWRVTIAGASAGAGAMKFAVRPKSQAPIEVPVAIAKDRPTDGIARDIRSALRGKVDRHAYTIELQGADSFLLTAEMGTPKFELALLSNSVDGVGVSISRE